MKEVDGLVGIQPEAIVYIASQFACYHYVSSIEREFWYALRPTDILTVILVAMDVFETYLAIRCHDGPIQLDTAYLLDTVSEGTCHRVTHVLRT